MTIPEEQELIRLLNLYQAELLDRCIDTLLKEMVGEEE